MEVFSFTDKKLLRVQKQPLKEAYMLFSFTDKKLLRVQKPQNDFLTNSPLLKMLFLVG